MKNIGISLLLALTLSAPAFAWKTELFSKLDKDINGEITITELTGTGCKVDTKLFRFADADRSKGLNREEYFTNREFFRRCK